ncbi:polysaccharide deacetylase family protein [Mesobacillus maritimus]|uniref:polysaccharide deacetylase family protein n=1 Tax=Mesobacillus maritimus TaxID=1643336 RepID=UPI00203FD109|nr:polysaccharide deacetylase family protein [Mesobacillus maritimus]MCM3669759.1 polysaccharide deacetylase family protein [Mesobacillus maritimus]
MVISIISQSVVAETKQEANKNPRVLVIYSTESGEKTESQNLLDMLIGHFSTEIIFRSSKEVQEKDLDGVDTLFYYGEDHEVLPDSITSMFNRFDGTIVAIGHNVEFLGEPLAFIEHKGEALVDKLTVMEQEKQLNINGRLILNVKSQTSSETLISGEGNGIDYPLFIKKDNAYYFASENIDTSFSLVLGEVLHEVFQVNHPESHPAYLRLEDVHPLADPKILKEIADLLKEKNIPYIVSVIPLYRNQDTGELYNFSDFPKVLSVLKYMQDNGGTIIVHGYTHQYKDDETGEGFEFWDVEANMPITVPPDQTPEKKYRSNFNNDEEYLEFLAKQKNFEVEYITNKVTKALEELVGHGLYPVAFEAPHYTMSQSGYEILSKHFSGYVGQLQLGDRDWRVMAASPYLSAPSFLHGMYLYPETIGFVEPDDPNAIDKMMKAAEDMQIVRDGYISGFYHPYLGVERFEELINRMEKLPNLSWIDLKKESNYVDVQHISVTVDDSEEMNVSIDYFGLLEDSPDFYTPKVKAATNTMMWVIAGVAGSMVILFIIFIIRQRVHRRNVEGGTFNG